MPFSEPASSTDFNCAHKIHEFLSAPQPLAEDAPATTETRATFASKVESIYTITRLIKSRKQPLAHRAEPRRRTRMGVLSSQQRYLPYKPGVVPL